MANYSLSSTVNGLGTFSFGVPNIGTYSIQGNITLPTESQGSLAPSQVVVIININGGATVYTGTAGSEGFSVSPLVVTSANSQINVILSSAAAVDQGLNIIKTTVSIAEVS